MEALFKTNEQWPQLNGRWDHSDVKNVPYLYLFNLVDEFVSIGGLNP
jgi:hypothetical protein